MNFLDLKFPPDQKYSSDSNPIPIEFFLEVLPCTKVIYLKLGYFSSAAIQVLSSGFAQFIYNGGVIKIVTNHFLYNNDKELIEPKSFEKEELLFKNDLKWIQDNLEGSAQHFINCLKHLVKFGKLEIIPVILKPNRMVHYKEGIFVDNEGHSIYLNGGCNFTANGLLENGESFDIFCSWKDDFQAKKVNINFSQIESIVQRKNNKYYYLNKDKILDALESKGHEKDIKDLLSDELDLLQYDSYQGEIKKILRAHHEKLKKEINKIESEPRFPFNSFPRDYQSTAYKNWKENNKQGIFAMATGTGKTITSLNCLLNEYLEVNSYQAIILVPSKILLEQWNEEVSKFNFQNIILVSSKYKWKPEIDALNTDLLFDDKKSFVIIVTYASFTLSVFQSKTKDLPSSVLLIADEAHNMGQNNVKKVLPTVQYNKRLALSATPKRNYDPESNKVLEEFFNSKEPYTYSFPMERAIIEGILCRYEYYPHIISLSDEEMIEYRKISKQLAKFYNNEEGFSNNSVKEKLLLKRKRIIHKAENKLASFKAIISDHINEEGKLKYTFVYAPEGSDNDGDNMLEKYMKVIEDDFSSIKAYPYTSTSSNNKEVMKNFEDGYTDVLFSMKCLDEGVDIPRAELAIFCASTGNPRQFIQRRGRVLRKHPDKSFAVIHDLVVIPIKEKIHDVSNIEKNLIKGELARVIHFASLANNYYEAMEVCKPVADNYDLNIYALEEELRVNNEL